MSGFNGRLAASLKQFGEPILIEGDQEVQTIVRTVSPAEARVYLPEATVNSSGRPIRGFFVLPDTEVNLGDTIEWLGDSYQVAYIRRYRVGGEDLGLSLVAVLP